MGKKYGIQIICTAILVIGLIGTASATTWYGDDSGGADFTVETVLTTFTVEPETASLCHLCALTVEPALAILYVGDTQQFTTTVYDQYGNPKEGVFIIWMSTNTTVGTVSPASAITDADGTATTTFTALEFGTTNVMASNGTVFGWATVILPCCSPPTVTITTDAITYSPGDTMIVTLDIATCTPVTFEWYIGVPQLDIWVTYASAPIPAGFDNSYTIPIPVGDWGPTPFGLVHYVHMLEPVSGDVLVQDVALCAYSPGKGAAMPVEVEEEIMKTIERVEFSI